MWDHAHNDYLELAAENGIAGVALVMLFALAVLRASRREQPIRAVQVRLGPHEPPSEDLHSFELPEWRAALREHPFIRCGLAGGVAAALAQSLVDFGLHMPANFLALMVVVALLVLSGRSQRAGGTGALGLLLVLLVAAAGPQLANSARLLAGAAPVSSRDCLEKADLVLAEDGDRGRALALVRRGLDRSPASLEGHEALAAALEPGPAAAVSTGRSSPPPGRSGRGSWRISSPCSRPAPTGGTRRPRSRPRRSATREASARWCVPHATISRRTTGRRPNRCCGQPCSGPRNGATSTARSRWTSMRRAATSPRRRACSMRASATRSTCCRSTRASRRCSGGVNRWRWRSW